MDGPVAAGVVVKESAVVSPSSMIMLGDSKPGDGSPKRKVGNFDANIDQKSTGQSRRVGSLGPSYQEALRPEASRAPLRQNVLQHVAVDVCEAEIAPLETVCEAFVVHSKAVHDSRV
jgi:hypothetical protein